MRVKYVIILPNILYNVASQQLAKNLLGKFVHIHYSTPFAHCHTIAFLFCTYRMQPYVYLE